MGDPISQFFIASGLKGKKSNRPSPFPPEKPETEEEKKKKQLLGRNALIQTTPEGLLNPATTGRRKLTAF